MTLDATAPGAQPNEDASQTAGEKSSSGGLANVADFFSRADGGLIALSASALTLVAGLGKITGLSTIINMGVLVGGLCVALFFAILCAYYTVFGARASEGAQRSSPVVPFEQKLIFNVDNAHPLIWFAQLALIIALFVAPLGFLGNTLQQDATKRPQFSALVRSVAADRQGVPAAPGTNQPPPAQLTMPPIQITVPPPTVAVNFPSSITLHEDGSARPGQAAAVVVSGKVSLAPTGQVSAGAPQTVMLQGLRGERGDKGEPGLVGSAGPIGPQGSAAPVWHCHYVAWGCKWEWPPAPSQSTPQRTAVAQN